MSYFEDLSTLVSKRRVTPVFPPGRSVRLPASEVEEPVSSRRDECSGWSAHIAYRDTSGAESERRITCKRLSGHFGNPDLVVAFCHERGKVRTFRVDRIVEMVCVDTGELLDPYAHFRLLSETGALKVDDKALTGLARVLVFLARCDGEFHPLEADAIEEHFGRYARHFGGDDRTVEAAMAEVPRLAPDGQDLIRALRSFTHMPLGPNLCRFVLDAGAAIIDADSRHSPEEVRWAVELSDALKQIADKR